MELATMDALSDCDCRTLSVHSYINHRGEHMRGRRTRSCTRRTRGIGEVRSFRSRSSDQLSAATGDDVASDLDESVRSVPVRAPPASKPEPTTVTLRQSGAQGGPHVLQYNGELFVPVRAFAGGMLPASDKNQPTPTVATQPTTSSNLPDYLYYTLRTQPSAGDLQQNDPTVTKATSPLSTGVGGGLPCPTCDQLRSRVKRLEREKEILRSENQSLSQQLKASKRGLQALERSSISEFEEAIYEENEALKKEAATLREMLGAAPSGEGGHKGTLSDLRELLHSYLTSEKAELNAKLASSRETIAEVQEALLDERKLRRECVSDMERQLIEENTGIKARMMETEHRIQLKEEHKNELENKLAEMREKMHDLNATLGQTPGILPDLSADESEILLAPWCDIPDEVKECMDSSTSLQQLLASEDGLRNKDEMIRCLWYRNKVNSKALNLLQERLNTLGITSEDKLGELAEIEQKLIEKDNVIKELQMNLKSVSNGQVEFEKHNSEKIQAIVQERNDMLVKLDGVMSQNRLLEIEKQHSTGSGINTLEELMNRLSESYDNADIHDKVDKLEAENSLLKVGRDDGKDQATVASIHDVLHLTDPQAIKMRCIQLANERDQFLQDLKEERLKNSDEKRMEHIRNLESELAQTAEDRKELRQQVAHFTGQLSDSLAKHEEQMANKDREMTVLRLKLQEMTQERDELKLEWEKEKRNANDLKVTYHKEIKNQSHQARKEMENELSDLRKELDLAIRQMRSAQIEKDTMLEEMKVMGTMSSDRQYFMVNLIDRCQQTLQGLELQSNLPNEHTESVQQARQLLDDLRMSFPEKGEEIITAKKIGAQFQSLPPSDGSQNIGGNEAVLEPNYQLQTSIQETNDISSDLLGKLTGMTSPSSHELNDLRNGIIEMTSKFDVERNAYRHQLHQVVTDLRSMKSRLRAMEETKGQLDVACKAYEKKLSMMKEEASGSKTMKEENNRLLLELQQMQSAQTVNEKLITSLRARVDQMRRERKELRLIAGQNDNRLEELRTNGDKLREERDKLAIELQISQNERDRYRENFLVQQDKTAKLDQQIRILQEEFETHHKGAKEKNAENFTLRDSLMTTEQMCSDLKMEISNLKELLRVEKEQNTTVMQSKKMLESEIQILKTQLLDLGDGDSMNDVAKKIQELKDTVSELRDHLKIKDTSFHDLESQFVMYQNRLDELDADLSHERSMAMMAKSRCEALEDENDWLRLQNSSLHRRNGTPRDDPMDTKSRGEMINELIIRSQSKAQAMIASNPNIARTLTPNGLMSPSSEMTEHLPIFVSHSYEH